jgi:hypothetical protein
MANQAVRVPEPSVDPLPPGGCGSRRVLVIFSSTGSNVQDVAPRFIQVGGGSGRCERVLSTIHGQARLISASDPTFRAS